MTDFVGSLIRPVLDAVDFVRSQEVQQLLKRAYEAFQRLPAALRDALTTIGMNGWYPDDEMEMPDLLEFARRFEAGEEEKTNDALCRQFEARGEAILAELVSIAPERAPYFRAAFEAHRDGKYALSIPVFLAQADMWQQFTNANKDTRLYSRKKGQPKTGKWVASIKRDDLDEALLYPLVAPLPISASDDDNKVPNGALVRHRVLHGTDLKYATALNSYRALSHLSYVGSVIRDGR